MRYGLPDRFGQAVFPGVAESSAGRESGGFCSPAVV